MLFLSLNQYQNLYKCYFGQDLIRLMDWQQDLSGFSGSYSNSQLVTWDTDSLTAHKLILSILHLYKKETTTSCIFARIVSWPSSLLIYSTISRSSLWQMVFRKKQELHFIHNRVLQNEQYYRGQMVSKTIWPSHHWNVICQLSMAEIINVRFCFFSGQSDRIRSIVRCEWQFVSWGQHLHSKFAAFITEIYCLIC